MVARESRPIVTVDAALFTILDGALHVALLERAAQPFHGRVALIGGYLRTDEDNDLAGAVTRILKDKAGLTDIFVEQLMTFGGPERDPRGWSVSVAYYALVPPQKLCDAHNHARLAFARVDRLPSLPFDHAQIVAAALGRLRNKASYSSLPTFLLPAEFTFPELKAVYEIVMGSPLNDSAFRRKIGDMKVIEEVPEGRSPATAQRKRPAQLYRRTSASLVEFDRTV
jgi:8-oxo-dGTP diphosphatase